MNLTIGITREFSFCAAHRLMGHPKCGRLHGHNYRVIVGVVRASDPDLVDGMVIDFAELDRVVGPLIDSMDHRYLIGEEQQLANDPYIAPALEEQHGFTLNVNRTTAEELAHWFLDEINVMLLPELACVSVEVWETAKNSATAFARI